MKIGRNERGFTLIELMVVLIIIGILAAIAIPVMSKQTDKAKVKRAVSEMKSMKTIIDTYYAENGHHLLASNTQNTPKNISTELNKNGVVWLITDDDGDAIADTGIVDPWGNPYVYTAEHFTTPAVGPAEYKLISGGPDGKVATADADPKDDIIVTNDVNPTENCGFTTAAGDLDSSIYTNGSDEIKVTSK